MRPSESTYPADWMRIAERDLVRMERALRDADAEQAGFYLQQTVEKFLKAFLLAHGWRLRRIHDLEALLTDAVAYEPSYRRFHGACLQIATYYMLERYPLVGAVVTEEDVRQAWEDVRELIEQIRAVIP